MRYLSVILEKRPFGLQSGGKWVLRVNKQNLTIANNSNITKNDRVNRTCRSKPWMACLSIYLRRKPASWENLILTLESEQLYKTAFKNLTIPNRLP